MKSRIRKKRIRAGEDVLTKRIVTATVTAVMDAISRAHRARTCGESVERKDMVRMVISALDFIEVDPQFAPGGENAAPVTTDLPASRTLPVLHRKLVEVLALLDVRPIARDVKHVDYSLHEPVRVHVARDSPECEGLIAAVVRTGYLEGQRVLRPMLVEVLKYLPNTEEQPKEKEESTYAEVKKED